MNISKTNNALFDSKLSCNLLHCPEEESAEAVLYFKRKNLQKLKTAQRTLESTFHRCRIGY
jgi:hypothetical protein